MMKNSNLMTRAALTLLVMMLTATTAWPDDSGECGEGVTYYYNASTHTLTISGEGDIVMRPWDEYYVDITTVVIENGVTGIDGYAFQGCYSLNSVSIPSSVTRIGDTAFQQCNSLTSISIPNSVTSIGEYAFENCESLNSVSIPNSVTYIGKYAFASCFSLTSVSIPNSVTSIGERAFAYCISLTSVLVNTETPPAIGEDAFVYDADDRKIYVPSSSVDTYKESWSSYKYDIVDIRDYGGATYFNISYVLNGGTNAASNPSTYTVGTGVGSFANPTRTGYTFVGWYDNSSFSGTPITSISPTATGKVTLYAKWSPIKNISYVLNGGTNASGNPSTYTVGIGVGSFANPTRTGYTFVGWYDDSSFSGTPITSISPTATCDVTLYAKWIKTVKYTFGSSTKSNGVYEVNVSATGDVSKNYSVTITELNNGREAQFAFSPAADITLAWSSTEAFFSFSGTSSKSYFGGGDSSKYWTLTIGSANYYITNFKLYNIDDKLIYETNNNSKSCNLYLKNNLLGVIGSNKTHAIEVTLSETPPVYNINYELNGGTNASSNPSTYTGGTGVALANPTRTGYSFGGWYEDSSFSGTAITSISTSATGKVTLYAKWTANTYTVAYDANGGSGSMSNQTFTYDQAQNLRANTFTRTGKLFDGWNTVANGNGTSYSDGQSVKNLTDTNGARVTLYAQWKLDPNIYPTGSGTAADPYLIKNINHWNTFANANNYEMYYGNGKHIKLGADISGVTTTVGTQAHPFQGTFDGNKKTLTVNINETSTQGTAPFREINGATIKNLCVAGSVTGTTHAAALVGFSRSGTNTIEDCNVSASVTVNTGNNKHCGGLVGHAVKSTLTIRNCIYSGTINNGGNYAGGLQGWSDGSTLSIENSLFSGSYAGSGLFHPIAVRNRNVSMTSNISGAYYIAAPTLTNDAFIVTPGTQAYTEQQLFPCKNATILGTTIYYTNADFTPFGKTDSYSPDGSAERPFIISNTDGWDYFCNALQDNDTWNRFSGMTVKLGNNITVSSMAGSSGHEFCGTFDGDHHTLTVQYGTANAPIEQQQFVAPFVETARNSSPVFRNLTIDGNIYVKYADSSVEPGVGGLIGHLFGNVKVEHCTSNVVINSDKDRVGGFVGLCEYDVTFTDCKSSAVVNSSIGNISGFVGWSRSSTNTIAFDGCLFNGKLLQLNGTGGSGGCFVGWKGDAKTVNINNCLVAPATLAEGESLASSGSATFCRQHNDKLPAEIKNSYYTTAFGTAQGTQVHSIKAGEGVSVAMAGNVINEYETSGITFYDTGIMCDGKLYAVKDDVVSLTLSHDSSIDDLFLGYEAKDSLQNAVALTAADDNYKLTMPNSDVTISVTRKLKGDVNRDGNVDISDVVALVNIILNSSSDYQAEADLNNDGNIDISDVVALVNIILGQ